MYKKLAEIRNYVFSKIDTDYFFSVDSDIIVEPNVLKELIDAKKDINAATINNDKILTPDNDLPHVRSNLLVKDFIEKTDENNNKIVEMIIKHLLDFESNEIVEIDVTGACVLLSNKVCKETSYGFHYQGEDVAWSFDAQEKGFKLYAHTGLVQNHVMCEYQNYCIDNTN
jgi:GT2 family glycosyltransferase